MPYNSKAKKTAANKKNYEKKKQQIQEEKKINDVDKYEQSLQTNIDEMVRRYKYFKEDDDEEEVVDDCGVSLREIRKMLKYSFIYAIIHRKLAYDEILDYRPYNIMFNIKITQKEMDEMIENGTLINGR